MENMHFGHLSILHIFRKFSYSLLRIMGLLWGFINY